MVNNLLILIGALLIALICAVMLDIFAAKKRAGKVDDWFDAVEKSIVDQGGKSDSMQRGINSVGDNVMRAVGEVMRTQQGQLDALSGQLHALSSQRVGDIDALKVAVDQGMSRLTETVNEKLNDAMRSSFHDSFAHVARQLEEVQRGLGDIHALNTSVSDLKNVLSAPQAAGSGAVGQAQLSAMLADMLSPSQYVEKAELWPDSPERVAYAIKLPARDGDGFIYLPMDAYLPAEEYENYASAARNGDVNAAESAAERLSSAVLRRAQRMHQRWVHPPRTTDFAVMYIPSEHIYAELIRRAGLADSAKADFGVLIAGPTTLNALLTSVQMGFRTWSIERRSYEVWELLGAIKSEFGRFADIIARTQRNLRQATETIDEAARKTHAISQRLNTAAAVNDSGVTRDIERGAQAAETAVDPDTILGVPAEDDEEDSWD